MAKIHINFHITNIFLHQFAILWVICVGVWDYLPRRNHMGLRWFHTSEVWRLPLYREVSGDINSLKSYVAVVVGRLCSVDYFCFFARLRSSVTKPSITVLILWLMVFSTPY